MNSAVSPNGIFSVAYGPYDLQLDRRNLTVRLRSGADGAVLVDGLSLGWIELDPGGRVPLGECRLMSLSEKMGHQGKRILFGLEAPGGVPVDVYVICGQKEIQVTVEASRDTRAARVVGFGLMPGWSSAGGEGCLVLPWAGGVMVPAGSGPAPGIFDVCPPSDELALFGAFVGSVPTATGPGLCLIHDSIHGRLELEADGEGRSASWVFPRDPERRRLDMRVVVVPDANPVAIARAFRDNRIAEGSHITLRRKSRERPALLEALASGSEFVEIDIDRGEPDRWEDLERVGGQAKAAAHRTDRPITTGFQGEWSAPWVERWAGSWARPAGSLPAGWVPVPLMEVVWRDAVVSAIRVDSPCDFLHALVRLAWPDPASNYAEAGALRGLHAATIGAFVVGHARFGQRGCAECTTWSNGMRVWVNAGEDPVRCAEDATLPAWGWRIDPAPSNFPPEGIAL
ncbi:MAG: hypothetical protein ACKO5K_05760 [Armatimonadota bacterium]